MVNQSLINFIKNSLEKGYSEYFIRNGLIAKNWPLTEINESFFEAKKQITPRIQEVVYQKKEFIEPKKEKKLAPKKILFPIISFVIVALILTFTFLVYFYMNGLMDYTIQTPTGELKKTCLNPDCSDMKEYALNYIKTKASTINITNPIIIGIAISFLLVLLYNLVKFKKLFLWIINIAYMVFLVFIIYIWMSFIR